MCPKKSYTIYKISGNGFTYYIKAAPNPPTLQPSICFPSSFSILR